MLFCNLFLSVIAFCLASYGIGTFFQLQLKIVIGKMFLKLFIRLLVGLNIIIIVYALMLSKGVTILLPILPILLGVTKISFKDSGVNYKERYFISEHLFVIIVLCSLIFTARYFLFYDAESQFLLTPFQDYVYYSRLSAPLNFLGVETNTLEAIYPEFINAYPYHYFDVWLNSLLVRTTDLPSVWLLCISVYSILMVVICTGICAIVEMFRFNKKQAILISLVSLSITGVYLPVFAHWTLTAHGHLMAGTPFFLYPKTAPVYLFLILAVILIIKKEYVSSFWIISCIMLLFISTMPVIVIAMPLFSITLVLIKKSKIIKLIFFNAPILIITIYIAGFYFLNAELASSIRDSNSQSNNNLLPYGLKLITLINILVGSLINYVCYYMIFIVIVFFAIYKRRDIAKFDGITIYLWFASCVFSAALIRAITTRHLDSWQFFSNTMIPVSSVVCITLIAIAIHNDTSIRKYIAICLLAIVGLINNRYLFDNRFEAIGANRFSQKFLDQVSVLMPALGNRGGFILDNSDYLSPYMMSYDSHTSGTYVSNFKNNYSLVSLSVLDAKPLVHTRFTRDSVQVKEIISRSTLARFVDLNELKSDAGQLDSIKYQFIVRNRLSFICASRAAVLPEILKPLVKKTVIDSYSGEKLYILDKNVSVINKSPYNI